MNTVSRLRVSSKEGIVARRRTRKLLAQVSMIGVVFAFCALGISIFVYLFG
ncbi:MAG: hypothetical protein AB7E66_03890 [Parvibaculaceae bacterium]